MTEKRFIVRVAGRDLDGTLSIERAIQSIKGIGFRMSRMIALTFEKQTGVPFDTQLGNVPENMDAKLEEIVLHPDKFALPEWTLNRRHDFETGQSRHLVMNDLDLQLRKDLQRLGRIKSRRGLRHAWGLPVRGQHTRTSFRGGRTVGVVKKDAAKAAGGK